jgi:hypothetical protein
MRRDAQNQNDIWAVHRWVGRTRKNSHLNPAGKVPGWMCAATGVVKVPRCP